MPRGTLVLALRLVAGCGEPARELGCPEDERG